MSLTHPAHADRTQAGRKHVRIALLGCGTVGSGVANLLSSSAAAIALHGGTTYSLDAVAVRSPGKRRDVALAAELFSADALALARAPDFDLVVECIGGTGAAAEAVETALRYGKHVVTANKDLLATRGPELRALAARNRVSIAYEAAVGGAIPIVRTIEESLAGEEILEVGGVLNGTTNFILSEMSTGATYESALARAQALGFAEADPASDVEGVDAAHKLAILTQLGFRRALVTSAIPRRGIAALEREDLALAKRLGLRIKLIACARANGSLVTPAFVAADHPFAKPTGAQNCIRVIGRSSGTLTFSGTGAGGAPTASAVIGDIVAVLRRIEARRHGAPAADAPLVPVPGRERALKLPLLVRLPSLAEVRPARQALLEGGYDTLGFDGAPALRTTGRSATLEDVRAVFRSHHIAFAGILPLWEDAAPSEV